MQKVNLIIEIFKSFKVFGNHAKNLTIYFQPLFTRNWEVHMKFKVHGQGTRLFGDGFAFWYTKDRSILGMYGFILLCVE